jgi:hypothetical protein
MGFRPEFFSLMFSHLFAGNTNNRHSKPKRTIFQSPFVPEGLFKASKDAHKGKKNNFKTWRYVPMSTSKSPTVKMSTK